MCPPADTPYRFKRSYDDEGLPDGEPGHGLPHWMETSRTTGDKVLDVIEFILNWIIAPVVGLGALYLLIRAAVWFAMPA